MALFALLCSLCLLFFFGLAGRCLGDRAVSYRERIFHTHTEWSETLDDTRVCARGISMIGCRTLLPRASLLSRVQFQTIRDLQELNYWGHDGGDGSVLDSGPVTTPLWSPSIPVGRAFLSLAGPDAASRAVSVRLLRQTTPPNREVTEARTDCFRRRSQPISPLSTPRRALSRIPGRRTATRARAAVFPCKVATTTIRRPGGRRKPLL